MVGLAKRMEAYIDTHPFDAGDYDYGTIPDQLYMACPWTKTMPYSLSPAKSVSPASAEASSMASSRLHT